MRVDHTCPVAFAAEDGLLVGSPMDETWCLSFHREAVLAATRLQVTAPELLLWRMGQLSIHYAPWDWVNTDAKVMLVGITAGHHQANEALSEVRRCLDAGLSSEDALRSADAVGSFSGPMRANLVSMLDGIGVAEGLGIGSCARLFDTHHHLAAHVSAIDYPVFVDGANYGGANPPLVRHPALRALVVACLGPRVAMAPAALVLPLGKAAQAAVELLIDQGLLDRDRCVLGFPHPSGANGWRVRQYQAHRHELTKAVARALPSASSGLGAMR